MTRRVPGVDYVATSGTLTFSNGIAFQTFAVQIISNRFIEGDRTFRVYLTNATPTNAGLPAPALHGHRDHHRRRVRPQLLQLRPTA